MKISNCYMHLCLVLLSKERSLLVDVDECSTNQDTCKQLCTNTEGSYNCSCSPGFLLMDDGNSCQGTLCIMMESLVKLGNQLCRERVV